MRSFQKNNTGSRHSHIKFVGREDRIDFGSQFILYALRETVRALFELTRLHQVFPIEEHRHQAVERLGSC